MTEESKLRLLQFALQALAQPAGIQLTLFPDFVCKADELALDFDNAFRLVTPSLHPDLKPTLSTLDSFLQRHSGTNNSHLWTDDALASATFWQEVRQMAASALTQFGWPNKSPPQNPADRRVTYVSGDGN